MWELTKYKDSMVLFLNQIVVQISLISLIQYFYLLIFVTIIWFVFVSCIPRIFRFVLLVGSFIFSFSIFIISLIIFFKFIKTSAVQPFPFFIIEYNFFPQFPLIFFVDFVSISFITLTSFIFPFCVLFSWSSIKYRLKEFLLLLIIIEFFLFLVFSIINLFWFYIVFETILIPMFLLIGIWGSRRRKIHAAYQFFFYTAFGSFIMLLGLIYIYHVSGSLDLRVIEDFNFTYSEQKCLWCAFFIAFAIKVPLFPFHIWLPEAHVEAPTVGSVILAGVLLKMGTYGLFRFVISPFPDATIYFTPFIFSLCLFGILYTSLTTIRQIDLKKIIAYSSVGHMAYVILGLFSLNVFGISGSLFLMLGHGIISSALFFLIGCLYDRFQTRLLPFFGGIALIMPIFSFYFFLFTIGNMSFPGTINFIGEFLCVLGSFYANPFVCIISVFSIILTAIYSIWLFNRLCFGQFKVPCKIFNFDLKYHERLVLIPFIVIMFLLGLVPNILLKNFETIVSFLLWNFYHVPY